MPSDWFTPARPPESSGDRNTGPFPVPEPDPDPGYEFHPHAPEADRAFAPYPSSDAAYAAGESVVSTDSVS
jgi:hypothetical protein